MATKTYTTRTYRDGKHLAHLDRTFDTLDAALADAIAKNCKAYSPFFSVARED